MAVHHIKNFLGSENVDILYQVDPRPGNVQLNVDILSHPSSSRNQRNHEFKMNSKTCNSLLSEPFLDLTPTAAFSVCALIVSDERVKAE